jgi:ribose 5-phosphate isomerase B
MKVALGADHAGFALKDALKQTLDALGVEHHDFGTSTSESVDYPDFAQAVAEGVASGRFDRGILVCGSGIGMSIAANKIAGVRAALAGDVESARLSREHNDANVLTIGARLTSPDRAQAIVGAFLGTSFEGGRHRSRVDKIHKLESGFALPASAARDASVLRAPADKSADAPRT